MHPALATPLCRLFGTRYPLVQTGMGNVSDACLTAATVEAGAMGFLAAVLLTRSQLADALANVAGLTEKPFGVNIRAGQDDVHAMVETALEAGVRIVSFAGAPTPELMKQLKDAEAVVVPTVGALRHARKVADLGVDAVIVQGGEGGGHTGSIPTMFLVPQIAAAVDLPVIAAGGFHDGRSLVTALSMGAVGAAMGTRFLLTRESPVADEIKRLYLGTPLDGTVLTDQVDGMPQRVIDTGLVRRLIRQPRLRRAVGSVRNAWELKKLTGLSVPAMLREAAAMRRGQDKSLGQLLMAANSPMLYRAGLIDGTPERGVLATGQVVGLIEDLPPVAELIERIMADASGILGALTEGRTDGSA
ncbi:MAG: NAD(P)H-dependent flavin oxidoreductase [Actinomycetota bacterium]